MKKCIYLALFCLTSCSRKEEQNTPFISPGELVQSTNFSGPVRVKYLLPADSINDISVGAVQFQPGARTRWHSHPGGQVLLVYEGEAWYQERGKPRETVKTGELVRCPPDVDHWHGATQDQVMSHLAIGTQVHKGAVVWKQEVSEKEYLGQK